VRPPRGKVTLVRNEALLVTAEDHLCLAGCLRTLAEIPRTVVTLRRPVTAAKTR
jgi:hypothetical protein